MLKIGDAVAVLRETIKGVVVAIEGGKVKIEDEDGFIRSYKTNDLVQQNSTDKYRIDSELVMKDESVEGSKFNQPKSTPKIKQADRFEIDLHIEELLDYHTHLTNYEIVSTQIMACRSFVQESIELRRKRIVIIHGKGEGILKSEIRTYLNRLSNDKGIQIEYHDAPFRIYGIGGATEIFLD